MKDKESKKMGFPGTLSDKVIKEELRSGDLIIHPILDEEQQISGAKVDLRLDNVFYLVGRFKKPFYDPMDFLMNKKLNEKYVEKRVVPYGEKFVLHPNDYALAPLFEFVKLPTNILGRLDGRSSLGRLGIVVHSTAGSVDPGFKGYLVIELMNNGQLPVALYPLMRVATLILSTLSTPAEKPYEGKYGNIEEYEEIASKFHIDEDLKVITGMYT
jgi:dCTP deaminase